MKDSDYVYAIKDLKQNKLVRKRQGNPFFISYNRAKLYQDFLSDNNRFILIKFKLLEVKDEN